MDQLLYQSGRGRGGYAHATALYGILCLDEYCPYFMYASAGHPCPILYRPAENVEESPQADYIRLENTPFTGTPLGMGLARFMENFIRLRERDVLVFYSDGIIEMLDKQGNEYGYDRFLAIVKNSLDNLPHQKLPVLIDELKQDLYLFSPDNIGGQDDITVMAVRIIKLGSQKQCLMAQSNK